MKIREIIDRVDAVKPNVFTPEVKLDWINKIEGRLCADVFLMSTPQIRELVYRYPEDMDAEPLVTSPHDDIYELWLTAQIDFANGEYNRYNNSMTAFNAAYGNFVRWFADFYGPAQGYRRKCYGTTV